MTTRSSAKQLATISTSAQLDAGNGSNDRSDSGGEGSSGNDASRGGKDTSEEKDRTLPRRSAREKKGKTGGAGENKNLHKN